MLIGKIFGNTGLKSSQNVGAIISGQNGIFIDFAAPNLASFVNKNADGSVALPQMSEKGLLFLPIAFEAGQNLAANQVIKITTGTYTKEDGSTGYRQEVLGYVNSAKNDPSKVYLAVKPSVAIPVGSTGNIYPIEPKEAAPAQAGYAQPAPQQTPQQAAPAYGQPAPAQPAPAGYGQAPAQAAPAAPAGYGQPAPQQAPAQPAPAGYGQVPVYGG